MKDAIEGLRITRLDHHGIVAGVIDDLGLVCSINERIQKDKNGLEEISPGEAIKGMILNGLGFVSKPLSLTPEFFKHKAISELFEKEIDAEDFNRHKLGRTLDQIHNYGCELLFSELAYLSCQKEAIDIRFNSEDTTSFAVTGAYDRDSDEHTVKITHGYSKDHRADLKQVVHELMVSQDGGVPLMMRSWDGNESDSSIFKLRAKELVEKFKESEIARYLIADSKLYDEENAQNLSQLSYITRIPSRLKQEQAAIKEALSSNTWVSLNKTNKYYCKEIIHYGIPQRWLVVYSESAAHRAEKYIQRKVPKEYEEISKKLLKLSKQEFSCKHDAEVAFKETTKSLRYHNTTISSIQEISYYSGKGRPKKSETPSTIKYTITSTIQADSQKITSVQQQKSCYVIGSNIENNQLTNEEVIAAYKRQNDSIENKGFKFLKDSLFFVSSFFVKKPSRIMGLLFIMTLSLLVYSIAQRRLRNYLKNNNEQLPNQIKQPTESPTLRWIFQLMEGVNIVTLFLEGKRRKFVEGLTDLKQKIIKCFGYAVQKIYLCQEVLT